jgi:TonB family protein
MGAAAKEKPNDPAVIHWVPMPQSRPAVPAGISKRAPRTVNPVHTPVLASFPVEVSTSLPSIDVPLPPVKWEIGRNTTTNPDSGDRSPASGSGNNGKGYYNVSEVETAVALLGNTIPEYPSALRASGIEGNVSAEFVVTNSGKADVGSFRIVSATNEAFAESVRRALPRMRFRPATMDGHTVAQLVQQQFVFRLDR